MKTTKPREWAEAAELEAIQTPDTAEHFAGYAVVGVPFGSGHYLAFRRFPTSSVGPGYRAVWLRTPAGQWTIYADAPPELSCARYFGAALARAATAPVNAMAAMMGPALGAGRMKLAGIVPNGQSFQARPLRIWVVTRSRAAIGGKDAGTLRPLPGQARLGDFWLPQRGLFAADLGIRYPSTAAPHHIPDHERAAQHHEHH